jgi:NADPH:quinone reductase-like Zn-dependent oxidoreductase
MDAHVTGVCSTPNVELVRSLGADEVIDYTVDDFTKRSQRYDLIVDCVGNHPVSATRGALTKRGTLVVVGGEGLGGLIGSLFLNLVVSQRLTSFIAKITPEDLGVLAELAEQGKLTPFVDRTYPLEETADAIRYLETQRARGKVVIAV